MNKNNIQDKVNCYKFELIINKNLFLNKVINADLISLKGL